MAPFYTDHLQVSIWIRSPAGVVSEPVRHSQPDGRRGGSIYVISGAVPAVEYISLIDVAAKPITDYSRDPGGDDKRDKE